MEEGEKTPKPFETSIGGGGGVRLRMMILLIISEAGGKDDAADLNRSEQTEHTHTHTKTRCGHQPFGLISYGDLFTFFLLIIILLLRHSFIFLCLCCYQSSSCSLYQEQERVYIAMPLLPIASCEEWEVQGGGEGWFNLLTQALASVSAFRRLIKCASWSRESWSMGSLLRTIIVAFVLTNEVRGEAKLNGEKL